MGLIEGVTAAHNFPRERRADPCEQFHRKFSQATPEASERYPYRSGIRAFHTLAVMSITSSDASIGSQIRTLPTGTMTLAPVG